MCPMQSGPELSFLAAVQKARCVLAQSSAHSGEAEAMALWGSLASQFNLICEACLRQREALSQKIRWEPERWLSESDHLLFKQKNPSLNPQHP